MGIARKACWILTAASMMLFASYAAAAEPQKKNPVTRYWMTISTQNTSIPGMPQEEMSGLGGMLLGKIAGIGSKRSLTLQLGSPRKTPEEPEATHDIPPGMNMGKTLPLTVLELEAPARTEEREPADREEIEKPKARMLMYWGCGESVSSGQPKVLDAEKMDMIEFGKAMMGRTGSAQSPPSPRAGGTYAEWPGRISFQGIPQDSTLTGDHFVHGNFTPDIKFSLDEKHDFMAPVELTVLKGDPADSIKFQWKKIPTATGYFAMVIGYNEATGEMIIWSSSEVQEPGYGLMNYLTPADVKRFIKGKVIMGPEVTSCSIPKGIFKEAKGAMLQFIGYGDELNIAYP
ncbi:MAG: hypothetical protein JW950_01075, partial [Deltaproteobacteria bacterium]|nr:hypothetical protein [Deltaproteobacteria bacterium]